MQNFGYAFSLRTKREHTTGSALKPPIHRVFKRRVYFEPLMVHHINEKTSIGRLFRLCDKIVIRGEEPEGHRRKRERPVNVRAADVRSRPVE